MSNKNKSAASLWISNLANWGSSSFLSTVILAACLTPALWALQLNISDLRSGSLDLSQTCNLCIMLSLAIGISTFLANYVLLGHPAAFVGPVIAISATGVFTNGTVFVIAVAPIILGAIAGHYLNRYTTFRAERNPNSTVCDFVCLRFVCAIAAIILTTALIDGHLHWYAYLIWLAKMTIYLAASFRGIWKRAAVQIA